MTLIIWNLGGNKSGNSELKFYTSDKVELTPGSTFTSGGIKSVEVQYDGEKIDTFDVNVIAEKKSKILQTGDYYMKVLGKYILQKFLFGPVPARHLITER